MKTKKMKVTFSGFHGQQTRVCRIEIRKNPDYQPERTLRTWYGQDSPYLGRLSESAVRSFACRMSDCLCGESPTSEEFPIDDVDMKYGSIELTGNYA